MTPEAGQLQIEDIKADQDVVIADCLKLFRQADLTHKDRWDQCHALIAEHMERVRGICCRRLERELIGRTGTCPDYLAGDDAG